MSKLWLWVNMIQLQNSLAFLRVNTPVNILIIEKEYNSIINLSPPKEFTDSLVDFLIFWRDDPVDQQEYSEEKLRYLDEIQKNDTEEKTISQQEVLGIMSFNEANPMDKLKSPILFCLSMAIIIGILLILMTKTCRRYCPKKITTAAKKLKGLVMFNSVLRFILQAYFTIALGALLNIRYSLRDGIKWGNVTIQVIALIFLLLFAIYFKFFLKWNQALLHNTYFRSKFGALYVNVDYRKLQGRNYTFYFCIRRLLFAAAVVLLQ